MPEGSTDVVREGGKLSPLLARLRIRQALRLIPDELREGRLLDLGCGRYPLFLESSGFRFRIGLDQRSGPRWPELRRQGMGFLIGELRTDVALPVADGSVDAVTMLAVIEHIDPTVVPSLLREVRRVLGPGGVLVLTTPPPWADPVLRAMSGVGLASRAEHEDHKGAYAARRLREILSAAGFASKEVRAGYFELFMNVWAVARIPASQG